MRNRPIIISVVAIVTLRAGVARAAEVCGDGLDNDADSMADEGCWPAGSTGVCEDPLSCGLTGAIAPKMGSVVYPLPPDLDPRSAYGVPITFQRVFMSHYRPGTGTGTRNPFGNMWLHNWNSWLDKDTAPSPDTVIVHLPSGQEVLFSYASTGGGYDTYSPQIGAHYMYLRQATASPYKWELKTLTGEVLVYDWSSPSGKLIEVRDSLATPNVTTVAYDGNGRVQYVTDAPGNKRLKLTHNASGRLTKVEYQTIASGTATTRSFIDFGYNNNQVQNYQPNSGIAQTYTYASAQLTLVEDDAGNDLISYSYLTGTAPTQLARLKTSHGELGYEYASGRATCSGGTLIYFNRNGTATCDEDSDCGTGLLCGGETNPASANTGVCYRAARCLQLSSPSEDLVTTVAPFPSAQSCEGSCTDVAEYAWNTSSVIDLKGVKDPNSKWTSYEYNSNGLPTKIVYADSDNDATNGGGARTLFLTYGNSSFPGRVTERRRQSDLSVAAACTASSSTNCQRTLTTYNGDGQVSSRQELGFTLNSSGSVVSYDYTTSYTHDSKGRLTQIDGPLSGANDVTDYTYWSSTDVYKDGQRKEIKRKYDSSSYLITTLDDHDYWSNAKSVQAPDGTFTCMTFHADRNYLLTVREAMNGQTSCGTTHASDLTTTYTRDKALRLTKVEHPAGGCTISEYDTLGRLIRTKARDDCNAASGGEKQEYTYDDDGLVIKTETFDASSTVTRRQEQTYYDSRRIATVINPVNTSKSTSITYNSRGFVDTVDAESSLSTTTYGYDDDDRLTSVTRNRASGQDDVWTLVNDWLAALVSITDEDSKEIEDVRDDRSRKVKTVTPDGGTTLRVHNANGTLASMVETGGGTTFTHSYTSDNLRRTLTIDYDGNCSETSPDAETKFLYDVLPGSGEGACPSGMTCTGIAGRVAYVKTVLLCSTAYSDKSLDQETWYAYDGAGRVTREYVKDDTGRIADHLYEWTKNGALSKVTTPSGAVLGWTFGTAGDNSDQVEITAAWRTTTGTPIVDTVAWFPFGPLKSYRHSNTIGGTQLQTVISRNLAYRVSNVRVEKTTGTLVFQAAITEDDKGRVTARDFSGGITGLEDSYFLYDKLDRVTCETTTYQATCPTSGVKNSHDADPPFTASNDWKHFLRPIPGCSDKTHEVTLVSGKDQISTIVQPAACNPALGTTSYAYDARGNRTSDDNTSTLTTDARTYTYDKRRNVTIVAGKYKTGGSWHSYVVTNAYDARNRRVYKSFHDKNTSKVADWFFYYDPLDRLTEIRATPDTSDTSTYSVYQIVWVGGRQVHMWETQYPGATTSRRYFHTDETTRPIETYTWPSSGDATRYWATNPDAYGNDTCLTGCTTLQPFVHPGQYRDVETVAWQNDGATQHRPAVILNWFRMYDSFVGAYIQVDPLAPSSWDPYSYAQNDPVGKDDVYGLMGFETWTCHRITCVEGPCTVEGVTYPEGAVISDTCEFAGYQWDASFGVDDGLPPGPPQPPPGPVGGGDDEWDLNDIFDRLKELVKSWEAQCARLSAADKACVEQCQRGPASTGITPLGVREAWTRAGNTPVDTPWQTKCLMGCYNSFVVPAYQLGCP